MVQQIAKGLRLRQDNPSFGRFFINRDYEDDDISRANQIGGDNRIVDKIRRRLIQQGLSQCINAVTGESRRLNAGYLPACQRFKRLRQGRLNIGFVENGNSRYAAFFQFQQDCFFKLPPGSVADNKAQIGAVEGLPSLIDAHLSQCTGIVNAGCVDKQHRPQRRQFHWFFHRIGGCAGLSGDDRHLLARDGVEQHGFADIAPPEKADMQSKTLRR
ncbi:MAG: hypothetical protein BWY83_03219 [bacterium ADurb.Bin478]|nr:MAG: hypothetical protein BWY83_03219 [bacterium ADurb.Bin478]